MRNVVFVDKDDTLGSGFRNGLYPGASGFLSGQKEKQREIYVVTNAGAAGIEHLKEVSKHIDGYFGKDITLNNSSLYSLEDGSFGEIWDDYGPRRKLFLSIENERALTKFEWWRADRIWDLQGDVTYGRAAKEELDYLQDVVNRQLGYWDQMFHKETREPFDETRRYRNPFLEQNEAPYYKDLYFALRLIAPKDYETARVVMVGDDKDAEASMCTHPEIPLVVVSDAVREGNWGLVENALDFFYSKKEKPHQTFDSSASKGTKATINNTTYHLEVGERDERCLYCP